MSKATDYFKKHHAGLIVLFVLTVLGVYFLGFRHIRNFLVPSASMEPTLLVGDYLVTLSESEYRRGDIAVVRDNGPGDYIVKRIVAVGGDTVEIAEGALFINGIFVSEPYLADFIRYSLRRPVTVPEGHVFLLGDNRNNSEDSASDGRTHLESEIIGRVRLIYYPYSRFGPVDRYPIGTLLDAAQAGSL